MSAKPQNPSINFNELDLTKKLDPNFLNALSLDEITRLKRTLIKRAAAVIGEIGELKATDDFERQQFAGRLFRCELESGGEILFRYELDRMVDAAFLDKNFFVPGSWFQNYVDELEELRAEKAAYVAAFPDHKKQQIINRLLNGAAAPTVD